MVSLEPVFDAQALDSPELTSIPGYQDGTVGERGACDQSVIGSDRAALRFQRGAERCCRLRFMLVEG